MKLRKWKHTLQTLNFALRIITASTGQILYEARAVAYHVH